MTSILIVGSASLDTLHIQGTRHATRGGAGLYTALAAARAGVDATLVAPKPEPMPKILSQIENCIRWIGPTCSPDQLPRLEIAHHGDGKATLVGADWGATLTLGESDLPAGLGQFSFVHIAALPSAEHQLALLQSCRQRKAKAISCGTYAKLVYGEKEGVQALLAEADLFFMNENEAKGLFGSVKQADPRPDQTIFVTLDRDGAIVVEAGRQLRIEGMPVKEVDPTGAGDTFCGTTLAGVAQGASVVEAAQRGCQHAAQTVQGIGPSFLLKVV